MPEATSRDYAAEVVAHGRVAPEEPELYNAIRQGIDDWLASTSEVYAYDGRGDPNHSDGDPYCDGMARYIVTRIGWAQQRPLKSSTTCSQCGQRTPVCAEEGCGEEIIFVPTAGFGNRGEWQHKAPPLVSVRSHMARPKVFIDPPYRS